MEKNTKNFDRGIEQMMNEHEVTPSFGMWNRISSELETMPVATAGAPVITSLIPKRAMIGIIATALVIGATIVTGYLVSNTHNADKAEFVKYPVATITKSVNNAATVEQTVPVKNSINPMEIALTKVKVKHIVATNPVESTLQAAQQVQPPINQRVVLTTATPIVVNTNADVPTPIEPVTNNAVEKQTYYFPPIDVITPAKSIGAPVAVAKPQPELTPYNGDDRPAREHKIRFRPRRRNKYTYPTIIR